MTPDWNEIAGVAPLHKHGMDAAPMPLGDRMEIVVVNKAEDMPGWTLMWSGQHNACWYQYRSAPHVEGSRDE